MFEFFNANSGSFSVIFSGMVAIATIIYAILTWKLVSETKRIRAAQTEPKVSISIQPRDEWINLIDMKIQNIGLGPAYSIKFELENDFKYRKEELLSEIGIIKNGINFLSPNQKIQFFLTSLADNFEEKVSSPFTIKVTYKNNSDHQYNDKYMVDFSEFLGLRRLGEPPLHKIAKNIESIKKDIGHISSGFSKIRAIVQTKKEYDEELEKYNEKQEEMARQQNIKAKKL
ncbi:MAG: hypothetical protein ACE5EN_11145 [Nitrospinota bacterium]